MLSGEEDLLKDLTNKMYEASDELNFERALEYKQLIDQIKAVTSKQVIEFDDITLDKVSGFFSEDEEGSVIRIDATDVQEIAEGVNKLAKAKKLDSDFASSGKSYIKFFQHLLILNLFLSIKIFSFVSSSCAEGL